MYKHNIQRLIYFTYKCKSDKVTKEIILNFKESLNSEYKKSTINTYVHALNKFFTFIERDDFRIKKIKEQRTLSLDNVLSKSEYERLLKWAKKLKKDRIYYIMRVLAGTGIRIEELKFITFESLTKGQAEVNNKGKSRIIVISSELCKELKKYCKENGITQGIIFHGRDKAKLIDKVYIWREMKTIAGHGKLNKSKVHAHSFRHLFAKTYMEVQNNVVELADLLGHCKPQMIMSHFTP